MEAVLKVAFWLSIACCINSYFKMAQTTNVCEQFFEG